MCRSIVLLCLFAAMVGCSQQPPTVEVAGVTVVEPPLTVTIAEPPPTTPANPTKPPDAPAASPSFPFPFDLAGKELPRVVAPVAPEMLATEKFGVAPLVRSVPARIATPEPTTKVAFVPPSVPISGSATVRLAPPPERVPLDLGMFASVPARPVLADAPVKVEKARDVNVPPPLPQLGRPLNDRVGLDDPTADPANARIVEFRMMVGLVSAAFQRVGLPNPFELAEQVKPMVPATAEPGLGLPITVNPQRPK